jgi:hypothetical protein
MTVWASSPAVKRIAAAGDARPSIALSLDAPVTRRSARHATEAGPASDAAVRSTCVQSLEKTEVSGGLRLEADRARRPE